MSLCDDSHILVIRMMCCFLYEGRKLTAKESAQETVYKIDQAFVSVSLKTEGKNSNVNNFTSTCLML